MPTGLQGQHQWFQEKKRRNKKRFNRFNFQIHMRSGESLRHHKEMLPLQGSIKILQYEIFK